MNNKQAINRENKMEFNELGYDKPFPRCLTIAGSDSGGGAGIQADLKTFGALGAYGASVITALTAQNTQGVQAVQAVSPEMVRAQCESVLSDIRIDAVKIGMLPDVASIRVVAEVLGLSGAVCGAGSGVSGDFGRPAGAGTYCSCDDGNFIAVGRFVDTEFA